MRVEKLRDAADDTGLVPAGHYFARLARNLQHANAREHAKRLKLDAEDRRLEASYRRASAARGNTFADTRGMV
ncbi:MAG TPA: hypothetical protein VEA80_19465 [Vitreimonas sp.]|uniref:hypothetical protein n=1 Tax=Vitreimonas sp. TaxID=3069702 RepID=UPI002D6C6D2D|nr:hypothetical protein [Vitreimonas sp.]HYD89669.1 hypothetical protein [Vitreimonas sp.]